MLMHNEKIINYKWMWMCENKQEICLSADVYFICVYPYMIYE